MPENPNNAPQLLYLFIRFFTKRSKMTANLRR